MMMLMAMMVMMLVVTLSQCPIGFQLCPHIDDDDYGHDGDDAGWLHCTGALCGLKMWQHIDGDDCGDDAGGYIILVPYWIPTVPAH